MSSESYIQIAADGAGKRIRNLKITERSVDLDGLETFVDRYAQVVAITDGAGNVLDFNQADVVAALQDIITELRMMNLQLRNGFEGKLSDVKHELRDLRQAVEAGVTLESFR